jgi:hypothetical protein
MSGWVDGWPESTDYVGPRVVRRDDDGIRWEWDDPPAKWHNTPNFVEVYRASDGSLNLDCGQDEHEMGGFVELSPELARSIAAELIRLADTPTPTVLDTSPPV